MTSRSGWRQVRLGNVAETIVPQRDKPEDLSGPIPWLRIEDFDGKHLSSSKSGQGVTQGQIEAMPLRVFPARTVVTSCSCVMGATAIAESPIVTNQTFIGLLPDESELSSDFLYYVMQAQQEHLQMQASGAIQQYLSQSEFRSLRFMAPSIEEQLGIAVFLDRETARTDTLIAEQQHLVEMLRERRLALVESALSGGTGEHPRFPWLGDVRADWQVLPLKYAVAVPITDGPHETPTFVDEGIPFLSAEGVSRGIVNFSRVRGYITQADHDRFSRKYKPRRGDIFLVKSGATTGTVAIVESDLDFNIWSPLAAIRPSDRAVPRFLFWFLSSPAFKRSIELHWSFGTQQNIGMGVLGGLPVLLPPVEEQRRIAAFLDEKTAKIDQLIAETQRFVQISRERRAALIAAAVTGQIDVRNEVA